MITHLKKYLLEYEIKQIKKENSKFLLELYLSNPYYINISQDHIPDLKEMIDSITELPNHKQLKDKNYFYIIKNNEVIAAIDFIHGYPEDKTGYIGLFMVNGNDHKKGIGSKLLKYMELCAVQLGYEYLELGCLKKNEIGLRFWQKHQFHIVRTSQLWIDHTYRDVYSMRKKIHE